MLPDLLKSHLLTCEGPPKPEPPVEVVVEKPAPAPVVKQANVTRVARPPVQNPTLDLRDPDQYFQSEFTQIHCEMCNKKYNEPAYERHFPICKSKFNYLSKFR